MGPAFYYISRCQNTQSEVIHLNISQEAPNPSQQLKQTLKALKRINTIESP